MSSTNTKIGTLNTKIGTLNTEIGTLNTEIETLNTEIGTMNTVFITNHFVKSLINQLLIKNTFSKRMKKTGTRKQMQNIGRSSGSFFDLLYRLRKVSQSVMILVNRCPSVSI
jgi:hypothetical protein